MTSTALEIHDGTLERTPGNLFGTHSPNAIVARSTEIADALSRVLKEKSLVKKISGREFVVVEGWTLLGTMLGVFPVVAWSHQLTTDDGKANGWEARVEARTLDGAVVGAAEAQCTREESLWGWNPTDRNGRKLTVRDDYALRSMAQTRAISKALRAPLGFIVTMAGYEALPADEMVDEGVVVESGPTDAQLRQQAISKLDAAFKKMTEEGSLPAGWDNWAAYLRDHMLTSYQLEPDSDWRRSLTPDQINATADWLSAQDVPF